MISCTMSSWSTVSQVCASQGTAAVVLAGILAAQPLTGKGLTEHDIMIAGDSAAGTAIAELLAEAIARQSIR